MKTKTFIILFFINSFASADCVTETDDLTIAELKSALVCFQTEINSLKMAKNESKSITVNTHANLPVPTISQSVTVRNLQIDLHACERNAQRVICRYTITNTGNDLDYNLSNYNDNSVAYDEFGIKHKPSSITLLDKTNQQQVLKRLIKNVPIPASSTFDNIPNKVTQFTVLNLTIGNKAEFRAIAIK